MKEMVVCCDGLSVFRYIRFIFSNTHNVTVIVLGYASSFLRLFKWLERLSHNKISIRVCKERFDPYLDYLGNYPECGSFTYEHVNSLSNIYAKKAVGNKYYLVEDSAINPLLSYREYLLNYDIHAAIVWSAHLSTFNSDNVIFYVKFGAFHKHIKNSLNSIESFSKIRIRTSFSMHNSIYSLFSRIYRLLIKQFSRRPLTNETVLKGREIKPDYNCDQIITNEESWSSKPVLIRSNIYNSKYSRIGLVSDDGNVSICRNELEQAGVDYRFLFNVFNIYQGVRRKLSDKEVGFLKENSYGFIALELYQSVLFKALSKVATPFVSLVAFLLLLVKYKVNQLDRIHAIYRIAFDCTNGSIHWLVVMYFNKIKVLVVHDYLNLLYSKYLATELLNAKLVYMDRTIWPVPQAYSGYFPAHIHLVSKYTHIAPLTCPEATLSYVPFLAEDMVKFGSSAKNFILDRLGNGQSGNNKVFIGVFDENYFYEDFKYYKEYYNGIIEFAEQNTDVVLLIKPKKPNLLINLDSDKLKIFRRLQNQNRIILFDAAVSPNTIFDVADMVITMLSTVYFSSIDHGLKTYIFDHRVEHYSLEYVKIYGLTGDDIYHKISDIISNLEQSIKSKTYSTQERIKSFNSINIKAELTGAEVINDISELLSDRNNSRVKLKEFIKNNSINHEKIKKLSDENLNKAYKDAVMEIQRSLL